MKQRKELVSIWLSAMALGTVAAGVALFLSWSLGGVLFNPDGFPLGRF